MQKIRTALLDGDIDRIIHLPTLHIGSEDVLVAAKVVFPPQYGMAEVAGAIDAGERRVRAAVPTQIVMYLEPDLYRADLASRFDGGDR